MHPRRIGLGLTICLAVLGAPALAGNIDQGLQEVLAASKPNDVVSVIVYLNQQVDLPALHHVRTGHTAVAARARRPRPADDRGHIAKPAFRLLAAVVGCRPG